MRNGLNRALCLVILWGVPAAVWPAPATPSPEAVVDTGANPQPPVSSQVARKELQLLLDDGLKLLSRELVTEGTFYPFAAILGHDQQVRLIGTPRPYREAPPGQAVAALVTKARELAREQRLRAVAFFMDYMATRQDTGFAQPGIRVELNHIDADPMSVFVPYRVTDDKKLRLLTPQYKPGKHVVFQDSD